MTKCVQASSANQIMTICSGKEKPPRPARAMAVAHGLEDAAAAAGPDEDLVRGVGATDARRDLAMVPREADLLGRRGRGRRALEKG